MRKKAFSQLIAPFKRVTDAPMELDFKFASLDELKVWAAENAAIIHAGLLKVVENEDTKDYDFYSFKEIPTTSGSVAPVKNFEIVRLFSVNSIDGITSDIDRILKQIKAIWGVENPENIDERFNSIAKLAEAVNFINERIKVLKSLHQVDKAIIGYTGDDLIEYLTTLKYNSITVLNNALDDFWNTTSEKGQPIGTWMDLQNFLAGYTNDQQLKDVILEITGGKLDFVDSDTIGVEVTPLKDRIQVKHSVKLGSGVTDNDLNNRDNNFIIVKNGGLFYNMQIVDTGKALRFKCNGNIVHIFEYADIIDQKIGDQTEGLVDIKDIYYDQANEQIVITFDTRKGDKVVRIPMSIIIREWEPMNIPGEPVKLDLGVAAGDGKDKLKAILKVSTEPKNLVEKLVSGLYVSGDSKSHSYKESTVHDTLEGLQNKDVELTEKIKEESALAEKNLGLLKDEINHKFDDKDIEFNQKLKDEAEARWDADKVIERKIEDSYTSLNARIDQEVAGINESIKESENKANEALENHAKDNAAEFQRVDSRIDDTNKSVEDLSDVVADNKVDIERKLSDSHIALNNRMDADKAELEQKISDSHTALNGRISDVEADFSRRLSDSHISLNNRITDEVATINARIDSSEIVRDSKFDEVNKSIADLGVVVDSNKADIEQKLKDSHVALSEKMNADKAELNQAIADSHSALNDRITQSEAERNAMIEAVNESIGELSDTVVSNKAELEQKITDSHIALNVRITDEVNTLDGKIESLNGLVSDNKAELEQKITDSHTALNERITGVEEDTDIKLGELNQSVNETISGEVSALGARIDGLTDTVSENKEDIERKLSDSHISLNERITSESAALEAKIEEAKQESTDELAEHNTANEARFEEIVASIADTNTSVSDLSDVVSANKADIEQKLSDSHISTNNRITEEVNMLNQAIGAAVKDAEDILAAHVADNNANFEAIEKEIADNKAEAERLVEEAKQYTKNLVDNALATITNAMNDMKAEIFAKIEEAIAAHENGDHTWVDASDNGQE